MSNIQPHPYQRREKENERESEKFTLRRRGRLQPLMRERGGKQRKYGGREMRRCVENIREKEK
jgi:hypothetical protein